PDSRRVFLARQQCLINLVGYAGNLRKRLRERAGPPLRLSAPRASLRRVAQVIPLYTGRPPCQ
ncbi:hypothetical protein P0E82_13710, partial [Enterococcus faecalis]